MNFVTPGHLLLSTHNCRPLHEPFLFSCSAAVYVAVWMKRFLNWSTQHHIKIDNTVCHHSIEHSQAHHVAQQSRQAYNRALSCCKFSIKDVLILTNQLVQATSKKEFTQSTDILKCLKVYILFTSFLFHTIWYGRSRIVVGVSKWVDSKEGEEKCRSLSPCWLGKVNRMKEGR